MGQHVKKWGNSLAVRIPAFLSAAIDLKEDDAVDLREENGKLVIEKKRHAHPKLDELLSRISPETLHDETDWGPATGREVW